MLGVAANAIKPSPIPLDTGPVSKYGVTFLRRYDGCAKVAPYGDTGQAFRGNEGKCQHKLAEQQREPREYSREGCPTGQHTDAGRVKAVQLRPHSNESPCDQSHYQRRYCQHTG